MPKFSDRSQERLNTCHPDLKLLFEKIIKKYDCSILEGHRSSTRQDELYSQGKSKAKAGESKHNSTPSLAVDVAPWPIDWNDKDRFYHFGGYVKGVADSLGISVRWGGDWDGDNDLKDQSFFDLPHFELKR